jgi:integrase
LKLIYPDNPKFAGCYERTGKNGLKTYYIKIRENGRLRNIKVGRSDTKGCNPKYVKALRDKMVNDLKYGGILPINVKDEVDIPTVDQAWNDDYLPVAEHDLGTTTYKAAISRYKNHIKPHIGNVRLDALTVQMVAGLKGKWEKAGIIPQTMQIVWGTFSTFINNLKKLEVYDATGCLDIPKKINAKSRRKRVLSESQIEDLLAEIKTRDTDTWYQCCIMAYAGLRPGEVVKLRPIDIRLNEGRIYLSEIKSATQSNKQDEVPIDEILEPILADLKQGLPEFSGENLFPKMFKYKVWHAACNALDLNHRIDPRDRVNMLTPHCLRHSFATNMLEAGVDIKTVQHLMRHDDLASTMHYLHLVKGKKEDAMKMRAERRRQLLAEKHKSNLRVIPGGGNQ